MISLQEIKTHIRSLLYVQPAVLEHKLGRNGEEALHGYRRTDYDNS